MRIKQTKLEKFIEEKPKYSQDWPAYNMAQTSETRIMIQLLYDLMNQINFKAVKKKVTLSFMPQTCYSAVV